MNLFKGLVLGDVALFLGGLLQGLPQAQLVVVTGWFTTLVLSLASLALLWGVALEWKRKCWPDPPGLEASREFAEIAEVPQTRPNSPQLGVTIPEPVVSSEGAPLIVRSRLTDTLNAMVRNHYDNRSVSRASMVGTGQCSQPYWNLAQAVLVRVGFRQEGQPSAWHGQGSSVEDLKYLAARVVISDRDVRVQTETGQELIDLQACHFL